MCGVHCEIRRELGSQRSWAAWWAAEFNAVNRSLINWKSAWKCGGTQFILSSHRTDLTTTATSPVVDVIEKRSSKRVRTTCSAFDVTVESLHEKRLWFEEPNEVFHHRCYWKNHHRLLLWKDCSFTWDRLSLFDSSEKKSGQWQTRSNEVDPPIRSWRNGCYHAIDAYWGQIRRVVPSVATRDNPHPTWFFESVDVHCITADLPTDPTSFYDNFRWRHNVCTNTFALLCLNIAYIYFEEIAGTHIRGSNLLRRRSFCACDGRWWTTTRNTRWNELRCRTIQRNARRWWWLSQIWYGI